MPLDPDPASPNPTRYVLAVKWHHRWPIYQRLCALGIRCWCSPYKPLEVDIPSPTAAIQIWSVARQLTSSPQEKSRWLSHCWQLSPAQL